MQAGVNKLFSAKAEPYFLDSEFDEDEDETFGLEFISVGLVDRDGKKFYGVNKEFNEKACLNPWVQEHVIAKLPPRSEWQSIREIRASVLDLIKPAEEIEFWARNGCYDHFVVSRIFGGWNAMHRILKAERKVQRVGFRDTNELRRQLDWPQIPELSDRLRHVSINDARKDRLDYISMRRRLLNPARP